MNLGFKVPIDKLDLQPNQKLQFWGFRIDSVKTTVSLPEKKLVLHLCHEGLTISPISNRQISHIVRTLQSYCVAVDYGNNQTKLTSML